MPVAVERFKAFLRHGKMARAENGHWNAGKLNGNDHINGTVKVNGECDPAADEVRDYPSKASLLKDIYRPLPICPAVDPANTDPAAVFAACLTTLSAGLTSGDLEGIKRCFHSDQSYWRDQLAFTYHSRTFSDASIPMSLYKRSKIAGPTAFTPLPGARVTPAGPTLTWIDGFFYFETTSGMKAECAGMAQLIQDKEDGKWKIWTLSTWIKDLKDFPEEEALLSAPAKPVEGNKVETGVLVIGAGNAGLALSARLKALGVSYIAIDKAEKIGDNWSKRYDGVRFHLDKAICPMPFLPYEESVADFPNKQDLAGQCARYAATFNLNVLLQTTVKAIKQDASSKHWTVTLSQRQSDGSHREIEVKAKHIVQSTGVGSQIPYTPTLENAAAEYGGKILHSVRFKNASNLAEQGVKSVVVVGAANTAFDLVEDCHSAGLSVTMVQRSPTFIIPAENCNHPNAFGMYKSGLPIDIVDSITMAGPMAVGGQLIGGIINMQAAAESDRYSKAKAAGLLLEQHGDIMHHLLERCGGHYLDMGATELFADGKVAVKSGVHPTAYTSAGLRLSDGSVLEADCILWATGFADKNLRDVTASILGGSEEARSIAARMDATWGLDSEGEIRGLYKRMRDIDNYWAFAGFTTQHRYMSKFTAMQIKASLEGILPMPYRATAGSA